MSNAQEFPKALYLGGNPASDYRLVNDAEAEAWARRDGYSEARDDTKPAGTGEAPRTVETAQAAAQRNLSPSREPGLPQGLTYADNPAPGQTSVSSRQGHPDLPDAAKSPVAPIDPLAPVTFKTPSEQRHEDEAKARADEDKQADAQAAAPAVLDKRASRDPASTDPNSDATAAERAAQAQEPATPRVDRGVPQAPVKTPAGRQGAQTKATPK